MDKRSQEDPSAQQQRMISDHLTRKVVTGGRGEDAEKRIRLLMDQDREESGGARCESPVYPCPSFSCYSSGGLAEVANRVSREEEAGRLDHSWHDYDDDDDDDDDADADADFEFISLVKNSNEAIMGRQVVQVYPVFNRDLLIVGGGREAVRGKEDELERSIRDPLKSLFLGVPDPPSCSSSDADEADGEPERKYCFWTPRSLAVQQSRARCKKSNSTGSCSKRWRFLDILRRSNSEGKDSFAFLGASSSSIHTAAGGKGSREKRSSSGETKAAKAKAGKSKATKEKVATASAHETFYVRNRAMKDGDRRRCYLPYRKDLVNGLSRSFAPF